MIVILDTDMVVESGDTVAISQNGLAYPLRGESLRNTDPLGDEHLRIPA